MIDRRWLFDLGDQASLVADQGLGLDHVGRFLHEGERDPVHPEFETEGKVGAILRRQRRQVEERVGEIDALSIGNDPAVDHVGVDGLVADAGDADAHTAIVDQQVMSGHDRSEYLWMVQRDRHGVAVPSVGNETDFVAGGDIDLGSVHIECGRFRQRSVFVPISGLTWYGSAFAARHGGLFGANRTYSDGHL
jgi:hypothetical protein